MSPNRTFVTAALVVALSALAVACSPEVGSEAWCKKLSEKPKGDWSGNEAADYARHCIFK